MGTQADVTLQPRPYDFTDDAIALSDELTAISIDWEAFMLDLPNLAAEPIDPTLGIDDPLIILDLANEMKLASLPSLDLAIAAFNVADPLLAIAIGFAPAAAWTDPPTAFVPPDPSAPILVPTVPPGDYIPNVSGTVGAPPAASGPTVTLQNVTRVGSLNFVEGDTFLLVVTAAPNLQVTSDGTFNGVPYPSVTFGATGADGILRLSGVEAPEDVGAWLENWYVGGQLVTTFSFLVTPGN